MALIDRIARLDQLTARSNHLMAAGVWMWQRGDITRGQFTTALELDATDDAQLNELVAFYVALSASDKALFFGDFSAWTIALEGGKITEASFKARFGMT